MAKTTKKAVKPKKKTGHHEGHEGHEGHEAHEAHEGHEHHEGHETPPKRKRGRPKKTH